MPTQFYTPAETRCFPLNTDNWAVINPFARFSVSTVNAASKAILDFCLQGRTSALIATQFPDLSKTDLAKAIKQLRQADLLFTKPDPRLQFGQSDQLSAWIHVTNQCNLRCSYCYLTKTPEAMTWSTGQQIVDACFRSVDKHQLEKLQLKFSGGEAVLNFPLIRQMTKYAKAEAKRRQVNISYTLLSNGTCLTDIMIQWLKQNGFSVMISLDGLAEFNDAQRQFPDGRGSFTKIDETIDRLLVAKIFPHVSVTISERNVAGLPDLMRYLLNKKTGYSLNFYRENDCSATQSDLLYDANHMVHYLKETYHVIEENLTETCLLGCLTDRANLLYPHPKTCGVGDDYLIFDQHGNVAQCQMEITKPVTTMQSNDPLDDLRRTKTGIQNLPVEQKQGCKDCFWRYFCTGGCPLLTHRATGRFDLPSPNCSLYKQIFPEIVRLEGLRLLKYGK